MLWPVSQWIYSARVAQPQDIKTRVYCKFPEKCDFIEVSTFSLLLLYNIVLRRTMLRSLSAYWSLANMTVHMDCKIVDIAIYVPTASIQCKQ